MITIRQRTIYRCVQSPRGPLRVKSGSFDFGEHELAVHNAGNRITLSGNGALIGWDTTNMEICQNSSPDELAFSDESCHALFDTGVSCLAA
jgi:hypothetical protein